MMTWVPHKGLELVCQAMVEIFENFRENSGQEFFFEILLVFRGKNKHFRRKLISILTYWRFLKENNLCYAVSKM